MYSFCFEAKVLPFRQTFSKNQFSNRNCVDSSRHKWGHSTWPPISKSDVFPASIFWVLLYDVLSIDTCECSHVEVLNFLETSGAQYITFSDSCGRALKVLELVIPEVYIFCIDLQYVSLLADPARKLNRKSWAG